ncbi:hypothetical protein GCM10009724_07540 [Microbacterium lacticum]|nr:hypothetical protein MLA01_18530 [Microbacterium lacticum]GGN16325.1 hypothetical protein GCM10009724_07540 [Microbacterium lacticum]
MPGTTLSRRTTVLMSGPIAARTRTASLCRRIGLSCSAARGLDSRRSPEDCRRSMHCPGSDPALAEAAQECGTSLVYVPPGRVANPGVSRRVYAQVQRTTKGRMPRHPALPGRSRAGGY